MGSGKRKVLILLVLLSLCVTSIFFILCRLMYTAIESKSFTAMVKNTTDMMEITRDVAIENLEFHIRNEKWLVSDNARQYGSRLFDASGMGVSTVLKHIPLPEYGLDSLFYRRDRAGSAAWGTADPADYQADLAAAWNGEVVLDGPKFRSDGSFTLMVASPVYQGGKVEGILATVMDGYCLSEWISDIQFPLGGGLAYIVDQDGTNIAVSTLENRDWVETAYNAQELAKDENDIESRTIADLEIQPLKGITGSSSYLWEGSRNYLVFAPVEETGWGFFVGFYGEMLWESAREITSSGFSLNQAYMVALVLILCILSIVEIRWIGKEQRDNTILTAQKEELAALQKKTEEQSALIREHHNIVLSSLDYARKIQNNLLPDKKNGKAVFSEFGVIWSPKEAVGGDFYWLKAFEGGTLLCVCDCTGHGVPGALLTMLVATALDAIVEESNYKDPAEVMWRLERKLVAMLNVQGCGKRGNIGNISDGADLALLSVGKGSAVTFASGNMHVFVCDGTAVTDYKGQRLRIGEGTLGGKEQIKPVVIPQDKRNRFYVASDGFFDQAGGQMGRPFGYSTFKQVILEHHSEPMDTVIEKLWEAFENYRGDECRRDDVEVVGFQA